jgi:hypothetical protein
VRRAVPALLALLLDAPPAQAQAVRVRAEVDAPRIGLEDQLQLSVVVEGPADVREAPAPGALKNLRLVGGPMLSQQISFVNGVASQSRTYTYVLQPQAAGPAEIGAIRVKLVSGEQSTAPIAVEVVPGQVKPRGRPRVIDPFGDDIFGFEPRRRRPAPKLFVEAVASRTKLYVGEPLLLTYYVYTQAGLTGLEFAEVPQYAGFWSETLESKEQPRAEVVAVDGENYHRAAVERRLLFPTKAGTLTIPAARLRLGIERMSFFDPGPAVVERETKPINVTAEPLPAEAGFGGAVGRFEVAASLDKDRLALGEAATLRFRVQGTGNLKWVDQGPGVVVPGARVFPPQAKSNLKAGAEGFGGSKTWEYVVVPETAGVLEVPALPFAYFDSATRRLVKLQTAPLSLAVEGGAAASSAPGPAPRTTASGGLSLRSDLDASRPRFPALGPGVLLSGIAAVLAGHAGLWGLARLAERRSGPSRRTSARTLRAALAQLRRARDGGLTKETAAALIERTLHDVFGPVEDDAGPPADDRERAARDVLAEVRFIRYAPQLGDYSEKIREVADRAAAAVRRWA